MKKGFATSAILYTMLLLFIVLLTGILNNLQNKKTILDALKKDTVNALQQGTVVDAILDQIGLINANFIDLEKRVANLENNTYNKEQIDTMLQDTIIKKGKGIYIPPDGTQKMLDDHLNTIENYTTGVCTREWVILARGDLSPLSGGNWVVETCRTSDQYAYQTAKRYELGSVATLERSLYRGTWGVWRNPYASNFVNVSSIEKFQEYCINQIQTGISLWTVNIGGAYFGAIVMKADQNYITFIRFSYMSSGRALQYQYSNGTWKILEL